MNSELRAKLEARLKYYKDLGIPAFYRDRGGPAGTVGALLAAPAKAPTSPTAAATKPGGLRVAPTAAGIRPAPTPRSSILKSPAAAAAEKPAAALVAPQAPSLFEAADRVEDDTLERIQSDIGPDCRLCKLCRKRNSIVFGVGNPKARLVFVGEGPGADEDAQGEPFVGRAGKLLTQMIEAMGLKRSDVYICNVVKCRPPENRTPEPEEIATCSPFLYRQLDVIQPQVIVCLGSVAAKTLLNTNASMGKLRQQWFDFKSSKLLATYHPAYCLRNPPSKADVWKDLQMAMVELGLPIPQPKKK